MSEIRILAIDLAPGLLEPSTARCDGESYARQHTVNPPKCASVPFAWCCTAPDSMKGVDRRYCPQPRRSVERRRFGPDGLRGLTWIAGIPNRSKQCPANNKFRDLSAPASKMLWVSNSIYAATRQGFAYVASVTDVFALYHGPAFHSVCS